MAGALRGWLQRPLEERTLAELVIHRLRWALVALLALFAVATAGYMAIDHFGVLDAAYMTVITMSTVGYGEVRPLDAAGRTFTIGIIIASFATFVYAVATLTNLFTSGEAVVHLHESKGRRMRHALRDHVIVVGFGRVGRAVAVGVRDLGRPCLVMDLSGAHEETIRDLDCVPLRGDATNDADLIEAGIERAAALVAAADQDDTNLIVTLTAHALRKDPEFRIVSRLNEESWSRRMRDAGATDVISPYSSYGRSLAASAITPSVLEVRDLPSLGLETEDVRVDPDSPLVDRALEEVSRHHNVFILGLRRDEKMHRWFEVRAPIRQGDILIAVGAPEHLRSLASEASQHD